MEALLQYVWKYRLYDTTNLLTIEGIPFEVIDPGILNPNAGPDFFNAKIKLEDKVWVGNVEIHTHSSDWYKHQHEKDKAYNSVILHVCECIDELEVCDESGKSIPQWLMKINSDVKKNFDFLIHNDEPIPCIGKIHEIPEIYLNDWKNALLYERLERKTQTVFRLLDDYQQDWNEALYILLSRNFGFGVNNDAFERLAKSLPLKIILKHSDSAMQTEALFLGQAGLLEKEIPEEAYYVNLQSEYAFLKKKYRLQTLDSHLFKSLRMRPSNFPHIKIIQLAHIIRKVKSLFSEIIETENPEKLKPLFLQETGEYWQTHYHFEKTSDKRIKMLGLAALHILWINTLVPILFAYGKKKDNELLTNRALSFLESLKPEKNHIVSSFSYSGINIENAGDTQALIQLKKEYCDQKKCIFCRIGHKLLSKDSGNVKAPLSIGLKPLVLC